MKYFTGLIPDEHRVLKDYFKVGTRTSETTNEFITVCSFILGILLLITAFPVGFSFFPFSIVLITTGILLFPKVNRSVADQLKFKLTPKVRAILGITLLVINVLFGVKFILVRSELLRAESIERQFNEKLRLEAEKKESIRIDSLELHLAKTDSFASINQLDQALLELEQVEKFKRTDADEQLVTGKRHELLLNKAMNLSKNRKYADAIVILDKLFELDSTNLKVINQQAFCNSKINNIKAAVYYCQLAMEKGSNEAEQLHEEINPLRKRVIGYETLCRDGTTSSARGRGACSHHGGVANWNHPIYEEYRKY